MIKKIIFLIKILIILFSSNLFAKVENKIVITVEDEIPPNKDNPRAPEQPAAY